jgi:hypothetical protein
MIVVMMAVGIFMFQPSHLLLKNVQRKQQTVFERKYKQESVFMWPGGNERSERTAG